MRVAVLGFGTVGVGVFEMINNAPDIELAYVLVRPGKEDAPYKVSDLQLILDDDSVECVVEVMGGINPAYEYAKRSLISGKHFVTSNKALVSEKGVELQKLAVEKGVAFLFSAACGGAVPYLHNLSIARKTDTIVKLGGILNGTTNFMLDAMQRKKKKYSDALLLAQELGYAESDPTADVTGLDPLRKIMLACAVAYGKLPTSGLYNEGIDSFTDSDVAYFKGKGLTCRLIASAMAAGDSVCAYVEPHLFTDVEPECCVLENFNMAKYTGINSGEIVYMGQGAGRYPTASAVLRDVSDIMSGTRYMFSADVAECEASNMFCYNDYVIRCKTGVYLPFKVEKTEKYLDYSYHYVLSESVKYMHETVRKLREQGESIFFASIN